MYTESELAKIKWSCRRGMKELDLMIMPFFEEVFASLPDNEQADFVKLLQADDPDLFRYCMRKTTPQDLGLATIVQKIIAHRHAQFEK